jgi:dolichol-phosphate mannosyltransferase
MKRIGRRGLAGAVIEGMMAAAADVVAVMDCDLQHDETRLPRLLKEIEAGADIAVATRYSDAGAAEGGFSWLRQKASALATRLTNALLKSNVSDPMSGFFMVRRSLMDEIAERLSTDGFKVLMDILASAPKSGLKVAEVPYEFRPRQHGASKLDGLAIADFLGLLFAKVAGNRVSPRFFLFALVGASGLLVHLWTLKTTLDFTHLPFGEAQLVAAFVAMTSNFVLNNALTFRDRRLRGFDALKGLFTFYIVCSVGTLANIGVADLIFRTDASWWRAGIAGALMAAVFNYAASSIFTWNR